MKPWTVFTNPQCRPRPKGRTTARLWIALLSLCVWNTAAVAASPQTPETAPDAIAARSDAADRIFSPSNDCDLGFAFFDGECRDWDFFDDLRDSDSELIAVLGVMDAEDEARVTLLEFEGDDVVRYVTIKPPPDLLFQAAEAVQALEPIPTGTVSRRSGPGRFSRTRSSSASRSASSGTAIALNIPAFGGYVGPDRGGYPIVQILEERRSFNDEEQLVRYVQLQELLSVSPDHGFLTITDWEERTYVNSSTTEICDPDGCYTMIASLSDEEQAYCARLLARSMSDAQSSCNKRLGTIGVLVGAVAATAILTVLVTPVGAALAFSSLLALEGSAAVGASALILGTAGAGGTAGTSYCAASAAASEEISASQLEAGCIVAPQIDIEFPDFDGKTQDSDEDDLWDDCPPGTNIDICCMSGCTESDWNDEIGELKVTYDSCCTTDYCCAG